MALSAGRVTKEWVPGTVIRSFPMKASTQIWEGGIVALGSDGYAVPGATSSTQIAVGVAQESKLSSSTNGADQIEVHVGVFYVPMDTTPAVTAVGSEVYIVNDQQVSLTSTSRSAAGVIVGPVDGTANAWVAIGLTPPDAAATVTALIANLASTSNGAGAALIGVEDSGTLLTAATVEAALAEIVKIANAGVAGPAITIPVTLSAAITSAVVYRFTPTQAGKISKISASVLTAAVSVSKAVTLTPAISTIAISGGALALTSANVSALGAAVSGTAVAGLNAFTAGQEITIVASSVTAFLEGSVVLNLWLASA